MDGWVGGWVDGWMGGWMEAKAGLRIAYSNQKQMIDLIYFCERITKTSKYDSK